MFNLKPHCLFEQCSFEFGIVGGGGGGCFEAAPIKCGAQRRPTGSNPQLQVPSPGLFQSRLALA